MTSIRRRGTIADIVLSLFPLPDIIKYIIRYGAMRLHGVFASPDFRTFSRGTRVVVHTPRGHETGVVLGEATPDTLENLKTDNEEDRIIRVMTRDDETEYRKICEMEQEDFQHCKNLVDSMELPMKLIRVERVFGGERLLIYYTAANRVDFRELVKGLAGDFHVRIEMRQIGIRDATKLLAIFGDCGRNVCCNQFLIEIPPVSMKMAKLQKTSLDPVTISGCCGRLKCCLRYEYDQYVHREEPHKQNPKENP